MAGSGQVAWHKLDTIDLDVGRITTQVVAGRALCITRTESGFGVLDNRCPHLCGGQGFRVEDPDDLDGALAAALAVKDGPSLVGVVVSSRTV